MVRVKDLMINNSNLWNMQLVREIFEEDMAHFILQMDIPPNMEQDSLVWTPSKSGGFSIKTAYRKICHERFTLEHLLWRLISKSHPFKS